jgi:hypothetical protein
MLRVLNKEEVRRVSTIIASPPSHASTTPSPSPSPSSTLSPQQKSSDEFSLFDKLFYEAKDLLSDKYDLFSQIFFRVFFSREFFLTFFRFDEFAQSIDSSDEKSFFQKKHKEILRISDHTHRFDDLTNDFFLFSHFNDYLKFENLCAVLETYRKMVEFRRRKFLPEELKVEAESIMDDLAELPLSEITTHVLITLRSRASDQSCFDEIFVVIRGKLREIYGEFCSAPKSNFTTRGMKPGDAVSTKERQEDFMKLTTREFRAKFQEISVNSALKLLFTKYLQKTRT